MRQLSQVPGASFPRLRLHLFPGWSPEQFAVGSGRWYVTNTFWPKRKPFAPSVSHLNQVCLRFRLAGITQTLPVGRHIQVDNRTGACSGFLSFRRCRGASALASICYIFKYGPPSSLPVCTQAGRSRLASSPQKRTRLAWRTRSRRIRQVS